MGKYQRNDPLWGQGPEYDKHDWLELAAEQEMAEIDAEAVRMRKENEEAFLRLVELIKSVKH